VESGAEVITTDAGFATHGIMIVEGDNAGYEGNVPREAFEMTKKED
jgi:hypothetical protein